MSKKIDRAIHGPGWGEVIFGAVLSAVLGVVIGAALLILKPIVAVKELPKEPVAGAVYYIEGSRDTAKAKQALAKRKVFAQGQSVTVTEDEINSLAAPAAAPATPPAPKPGEKAAPKADEKAAPAPAATPVAGGQLVAGNPNFRIRDGAMQIAVPVTISLLDHKVTVQARGGFAKQGAGFVFEPSTLYVGSCPVQRLPFVGDLVRKQFLSAQAVPEDIATSWSKLAGVTIEGAALKLAMP
jgi:hypothetical protein